MIGTSVRDAHSQALPLTFEQCLQRQKELREQAKTAGDHAWAIVGALSGAQFSSPESNSLYQKASELGEQANALKCAWHPQSPEAAKDGDKLKQISDVASVLRSAATSAEPLTAGGFVNDKLKDYAGDAVRGYLADRVEEHLGVRPNGDMIMGTSPTIKELINERFKELDDHNQALLGVLSKVGTDIIDLGNPMELGSQILGTSEGLGSPPGVGAYTAMVDTDLQAAEEETKEHDAPEPGKRVDGAKRTQTESVSRRSALQSQVYARLNNVNPACLKFPDRLDRFICISQCINDWQSHNCKYVINEILPRKLYDARNERESTPRSSQGCHLAAGARCPPNSHPVCFDGGSEASGCNRN
jgi:hypothetical protein